jgi:3-deoxy-D-manno-octulosonic-acid transferase
MSFLYTSGIAFYTLAIRIAALFNPKAKAWVKGRKGWKSKLKGVFGSDDRILWFHAASLGEFEQGRPVIEAIRKAYPGYKILLTFFSPSGYEQQKDYKGADAVVYLPADCPRNAKFFVSNLKLSLAVFIKYEFWYNYLGALEKHQVPTVFISALIKGNEPFMKWYGGWFRNKLRRVNHFFVQDQPSANSLQRAGINTITISGDTRFDRVADILANKKENRNIERFCRDNKVLLVGSNWPPDDELLKNIPSQFPDLKIILAPHEVNKERIVQLIATFGADMARYTKDDPDSWLDKQVLILDIIGILSNIYRYADIAYIGGGFASGLHNIQEPAVNGMPVIFGPNYHNFREAVDLVEKGGAFSINTADELNSILSELLENESKFQQASAISKQYMLDNTGATEKILSGLKSYL